MPTYDRKDAFYRKAKQAGFVSRGSWKLIELDKKFGLLRSVKSALDLGCSPGGWLQVLSQRLGAKAEIWGVDLLECPIAESLSNVHFIQGDIYSEEVQSELLGEESISKKKGFDLLVSDMSPNLSGVRFKDAAESAALVEEAIGLSLTLLRPGGAFVAKIFPGSESDDVFRLAREKFRSAKRVNLKSTRNTSKEFYIVAQGLIKQAES